MTAANTVALLDLPGLRTRESAEPGFAAALSAMAATLGLDASYIGAVMSLESGFHPDAVNSDGGASGLIQFMPDTAKLLGTTVQAIRNMSAVEQLDYVRAFYAKTGKAIRRDVPGDYYMATFLPAFVGKPADFVLSKAGEPIYESNKGLDGDGNGTLTVGDVTKKIDDRVAGARAKPLAVFDATPPKKKAAAATGAPSLPSVPSSSSSASSGQHSGSSPVVGVIKPMTRRAVVLAAQRELELVLADIFTSTRVDEYWADVMHQSASAPHPPAWCGALALHCLHEAELGLTLFWRFQTSTDKRSGFLWALKRTDHPEPGDVGYIDQPYQHHFIVECVDGATIECIDGNHGAASPIARVERKLGAHGVAYFSIASLLPPEVQA